MVSNEICPLQTGEANSVRSDMGEHHANDSGQLFHCLPQPEVGTG